MICVIVATGFAAYHNATMDIVKDHYSVSIFSDTAKYLQTWYDPSISWQNKTKNNIQLTKELQLANLPKWLHWLVKLKPGWDPLSDFWHWQKTQCGVSVMFIVLFAILLGREIHGWSAFFISWATILLFGMTWLVVFNYYYNKKLLK